MGKNVWLERECVVLGWVVAFLWDLWRYKHCRTDAQLMVKVVVIVVNKDPRSCFQETDVFDFSSLLCSWRQKRYQIKRYLLRVKSKSVTKRYPGFGLQACQQFYGIEQMYDR